MAAGVKLAPSSTAAGTWGHQVLPDRAEGRIQVRLEAFRLVQLRPVAMCIRGSRGVRLEHPGTP